MNQPDYTKGQVILPVDEYNKLLRKAELLEHALRIKKLWDTAVEVELDVATVYPIARKLFMDSRYTEDFELIDFDDFYVSGIRIAKKKEPTEDNLSE